LDSLYGWARPPAGIDEVIDLGDSLFVNIPDGCRKIEALGHFLHLAALNLSLSPEQGERPGDCLSEPEFVAWAQRIDESVLFDGTSGVLVRAWRLVFLDDDVRIACTEVNESFAPFDWGSCELRECLESLCGHS
jgi:hypothetical protein